MSEPQDVFSQALFAQYPDFQSNKTFGMSNTLVARSDLRRIYIAGPNLRNFHDSDKPGLVIAGIARFADADVYLGIVVERDVEIVRDRLRKMLELNRSGNPLYNDNNKNTRLVYSQEKNRFFLFNRDNWQQMDFNDPDVEPSLDVDDVFYSVYPPGRTSFRSLAAGELIRTFINSLGSDRVSEFRVWQDEVSQITPGMQRGPKSVPLSEIEESIRNQGYTYSTGLIPQLHAGFNHLLHKHFVILTGVSGTGKTSLVKAYARAVHGVDLDETNDPLYFLCPVRPEWTDPTGLTGYYDVISGQYIVPPFLEAVFTAYSNPSSPVFVCLDELNLARVEYYFSDFLSVIEQDEKIRLHSSDVPLNGSNGITVPSAIQMPHNLYIAGTINIDETTNPLSDKVLDRSVVIDVSQVDLEEFFESLAVRNQDLGESILDCREHLTRLHQLLKQHNLQFGYRVAEEFVRYVAAARTIGQLDPDKAMDNQISQKILVKLRGDARQRQLLVSLYEYFVDHSWSDSSQRIQLLLEELDQFGSFEYAR